MRARGGGKLSKPYKNGYQIEKKKLRDGGNLPVQCFIVLCKLGKGYICQRQNMKLCENLVHIY